MESDIPNHPGSSAAGLRSRLRLRAPRGNGRAAFTLIQLLVVLGIIVMLMGLALPAVLKAYRTGIRTRTLADLQLISTALEAYRQDFGDYPRIDNDATANDFNQFQDRGARLLCRALIGPGPSLASAKLKNPGATPDFAPGTGVGADGADGPGFRVREGTGGKTYGPYVQTDKFNLGGTDKTNFTDAVMLDRENNPILYYVATPNAVVTSVGSGTSPQFVATVVPSNIPSNYSNHPLYNAFDNLGYGTTSPPNPAYLTELELRWILGDRNNDGLIDNGETATTTAPYLLWTAGPDGIFGRKPATAGGTPQAGDKTDDITNFDIPADIRK